MQIKTKVRLITYKDKSFKNKEGKDISFSQAEIEDSDGTRFLVSVSEKDKATIGVKPQNESFLINGEVELKLMPFEKNGFTTLKLNLISFKEVK